MQSYKTPPKRLSMGSQKKQEKKMTASNFRIDAQKTQTLASPNSRNTRGTSQLYSKGNSKVSKLSREQENCQSQLSIRNQDSLAYPLNSERDTTPTATKQMRKIPTLQESRN